MYENGHFFFRCPSRRTYRYIGRCLNFAIDRTWRSCALESLKTSGSQIRDGVSALKGSPRCLRCCTKIKGVQLITGDAGQAYECISLEKPIHVLQKLEQRIKTIAAGRRIAVKRGPKACVFFTFLRSIPDHAVFEVTEVFACVFHLLFLRVYRFGNLYLIQKNRSTNRRSRELRDTQCGAEQVRASYVA